MFISLQLEVWPAQQRDPTLNPCTSQASHPLLCNLITAALTVMRRRNSQRIWSWLKRRQREDTKKKQGQRRRREARKTVRSLPSTSQTIKETTEPPLCPNWSCVNWSEVSSLSSDSNRSWSESRSLVSSCHSADFYLSSLSQPQSAEMQVQLLSCLGSEAYSNWEPWDKKVTYKSLTLLKKKKKRSHRSVYFVFFSSLFPGLWLVVLESRRRLQLWCLLLQQSAWRAGLQYGPAGSHTVTATLLFRRWEEQKWALYV